MNSLRLTALALALGSAAALPATAGERVVLGFPTSPGISAADVVFGQQLGFFKDEGIELEIVTFGGGGVLAPQVANKSVTFGLLDASIPILSYGKGTQYPIRFVYNLMRSYTMGFTVLADSPVKDIADLDGKTVGIMSVATGVNIMSRAALKEAGGNWDTAVRKVPTGIGAASWRQLATGKVDSLNTPYSETAKMKIAGMNVRQIHYPPSLRSMFSQALATSVDTIKDKPQLVAAMGRALAKSTLACETAPEACVRALWVANPESRPASDKEAQWTRDTLEIMNSNFFARVTFPGDKRVWGSFTPGSLEGFKNALKDNGDLPQNLEVPDDVIFTNQFVEQFNTFDANAVQTRARAAGKTAD